MRKSVYGLGDESCLNVFGHGQTVPKGSNAKNLLKGVVFYERIYR